MLRYCTTEQNNTAHNPACCSLYTVECFALLLPEPLTHNWFTGNECAGPTYFFAYTAAYKCNALFFYNALWAWNGARVIKADVQWLTFIDRREWSSIGLARRLPRAAAAVGGNLSPRRHCVLQLEIRSMMPSSRYVCCAATRFHG